MKVEISAASAGFEIILRPVRDWRSQAGHGPKPKREDGFATPGLQNADLFVGRNSGLQGPVK